MGYVIEAYPGDVHIASKRSLKLFILCLAVANVLLFHDNLKEKPFSRCLDFSGHFFRFIINQGTLSVVYRWFVLKNFQKLFFKKIISAPLLFSDVMDEHPGIDTANQEAQALG